MSISTLILNPEATGNAKISPDKYPATILVFFEAQGDAEVFYGLDGKSTSIPLKPGQTKLQITVNSLHLTYKVVTRQAKIQWELYS